MAKDIFERLSRYRTPYIPFPKHPEIFNLNGVSVYRYASEQTMDKIIKSFSESVNLNWFDEVLVNQKGAGYFAEKLIKLQNYQKPVTDIEYHRDGKVVTPIPARMTYLNVCIIEDILDGGGTAERMLEDAPFATFLFLTQKVGIPGQPFFPNSSVALKIDNVWVGGEGLNLESEGDGLPKDFARDYPGLIAKIL